MKKVLALLLVTLMVFSMAGCEKVADAVNKMADSSATPTPEATSADVIVQPESTTTPIATIAPSSDDESKLPGYYVLVYGEDGDDEAIPSDMLPDMNFYLFSDYTAIVSMDGDSIDCEWYVEGPKVILDDGSDTMELYWDADSEDDYLALFVDDCGYLFEKQ